MPGGEGGRGELHSKCSLMNAPRVVISFSFKTAGSVSTPDPGLSTMLVVSKSVSVAFGSANSVAHASAFGVPGHHALTKLASPGAGAPLSEPNAKSVRAPANCGVETTGTPGGISAAVPRND